MHEFPHALPAEHTLQQLWAVAGANSVRSTAVEASPEELTGALPKLAAAVASSNPITDAQILNVARMVAP
jgi:hypothetical protein